MAFQDDELISSNGMRRSTAGARATSKVRTSAPDATSGADCRRTPGAADHLERRGAPPTYRWRPSAFYLSLVHFRQMPAKAPSRVCRTNGATGVVNGVNSSQAFSRSRTITGYFSPRAPVNSAKRSSAASRPTRTASAPWNPDAVASGTDRRAGREPSAPLGAGRRCRTSQLPRSEMPSASTRQGIFRNFQCCPRGFPPPHAASLRKIGFTLLPREHQAGRHARGALLPAALPSPHEGMTWSAMHNMHTTVRIPRPRGPGSPPLAGRERNGAR